jgi:cbb3-type cytochrome oxidase subunit 3
MIKNVLEHIGGVGVYGVISICLFFTVFLGAVFFALRMKKTHTDTMSALPLDDAAPRPDSNKIPNS